MIVFTCTCFERPVAPDRPKSMAPVSVTHASRSDWKPAIFSSKATEISKADEDQRGYHFGLIYFWKIVQTSDR